MSESTETITSELSESTVSQSRGEALRDELQTTHALHTDGEWVTGTLTNIRVRPKFEFIGTAFDESADVRPDNYSIRDLHGSYTRRASMNEAPFVSMDDRSIPYGSIKSSSIDKTTITATSMEDLFLVDATDDEYVLVPMDKLDLEHHRTDCYLVGTVEFEVIGDLDSDEVLRPQSIVVESIRSVAELEEKSYFDDVQENGELSVEYQFSDDTLSIRHLPTDSKNVMTHRRFVQAFTISGFVGWLWGYMMISSMFVDVFGSGGWMWFVMCGVFLAYSYGFVKSAKRVYGWIDTRTTSGEKYNRLEVLGNAGENSVGMSMSEAHLIQSERQRVQNRAEQLKSELEKYPREVTVVPSENSSRLEAVEKSIAWNVTDGNMVSEESVDFFIEYGWTEDMSEIETHMVQDVSAIPDRMPALESVRGDWYLLPEEIQVDPIIEI